jgi:endothelin-converting enzyme
MADSRVPRPSADEESAPLLRDSDAGEAELNGEAHPSFAERITSAVQEPLTPLTKVLLIVALILLLLSSIFIGLFAGAQHKLNLPSGGNDGDHEGKPPVTVTATTTDVSTTTVVVPAPLPVPTKPPVDGACLSADCIVLSASILSSLDTTQDPCENFYDFATGGWIKAHPIPADKGLFGQFRVLGQENQQIIRDILESDVIPSFASARPSYDEQILKKLRGLYSSCMNEDKLDQLGEEPLFKFVQTLRDLFRGESTEISVAEDDDEDEKKRKGLTAALAFLHSRGIDALFSFDIDGDVGEDPNAMTLWFGQPGLSLPSKEYYEEESIRKIYQDVIERLLFTLDKEDEDEDLSEKIAEPLVQQDASENVWPPWPWPPWDGGDDEGDKKPVPRNRTERAHKLAKNVLDFESDIASATLDLDLLFGDPFGTYNPMPISNLTDALPQIQFSDYFSTFTPRAYPERVIVTYPAYMHSLSAILTDTSSDVVEAYLVTRAALTLAPDLGLNTEAWKAVRTLVETLQGIKKGAVSDRSEICIGKVEAALGFAAGRYFVNETFGGESRKKGTEVITNIIDTFKISLGKLKWMDTASAAAATEKADAIRVKVGFPLSPDTRQARSIAVYYNLVKIKEDAFFENMISAASSDEYKKWQKLGKRRDPETWEMYPSMVNAYFNPPANEIVFPAGILRPPFFSQEWPSYLSYGSFGMVAAHELTHAFDSAGRLHNQDGKLEEWWTNATSAGFNERQKCIAEQYSKYTVDDGKGGKVHVNGNLTSGENIGDSGIIQSYRAWKAHYHTSYPKGDEYLLPGLNYTREQLFFLSFARAWATSVRPETAVALVRTDPHSPARYRVDGTLSNVPEFAEAFKCPKGAKLNPPPQKRCILW